MTIKPGIDLGASFDSLKKAMLEGEEFRKENTVDGYIAAYSRLYVNVEHFVKTFDDPETINDILPGHHEKPGNQENIL